MLSSLQPNHFHFYLRPDDPVKAGAAIQIACNGYAQRFNLRHQRTGALFAGRFKALLVVRMNICAAYAVIFTAILSKMDLRCDQSCGYIPIIGMDRTAE